MTSIATNAMNVIIINLSISIVVIRNGIISTTRNAVVNMIHMSIMATNSRTAVISNIVVRIRIRMRTRVRVRVRVRNGRRVRVGVSRSMCTRLRVRISIDMRMCRGISIGIRISLRRVWL